jgi:hypothetical protein
MERVHSFCGDFLVPLMLQMGRDLDEAEDYEWSESQVR